MSGVINVAFESDPEWKPTLAKLRELIEFLRNVEYRDTCRYWLEERGTVCQLLLGFDCAGFAKWRYETLHDVFTALVKYRHFCEKLFDIEMFSRVSTKPLEFAKLCLDAHLWRSFVLKTYCGGGEGSLVLGMAYG